MHEPLVRYLGNGVRDLSDLDLVSLNCDRRGSRKSHIFLPLGYSGRMMVQILCPSGFHSGGNLTEVMLWRSQSSEKTL